MIRNLRDFSGYKNINGRRLKKGQFYRSAALCRPGITGKLFIKKKGITTILDLRALSEKEVKPDLRSDAYHSVPLVMEMPCDAAFLRGETRQVLKELPDLRKTYRELIDDEFCINGIAEVFRYICDPEREGAILWHCKDGQDLTGLVSALFLKMLDFSDKTIMKDYLRSQKYLRRRAWRYFLLGLVKRHSLRYAISAKRFLSVKEDYLIAAFKEIEKAYEDFDLFFLRIGVSSDLRKDMQQTYLR